MIRKKISSNASEWTLDLLKEYELEIAKISKEFELDTYPNEIEIITAEQMMDAYASSGMPVSYHHWSFGKQFLSIEKRYKRGYMGLAYEIVINSNPCLVYLLEENTLSMQVLVIAHAAYGHNSFFKGNYLFRDWTSADSIIDYLVFAQHYISQCEERYGYNAVEETLDSCHALMSHGVDRYRHSKKLSLQEEKNRQKERSDYLQSQVNELWKTLPKANKNQDDQNPCFPEEPEENLLYFIEKNSPSLESWQREILRITRKIAQYFYPQRQTKVMNEGWATFWHYTILQELYNRKIIDDAFMVEFLHNHTNVIFQPSYNTPHFHGFNPYTLGFSIFKDIKRICEEPTEEDKQWFPDIAGSSWLKTLDYAMRNFKDESFISQFLSPKVIRDLKLFTIEDDEDNTDLLVSAIHNDQGYQRIRESLAKQYDLCHVEPNIQIYNVNRRGDRLLTLRYYQEQSRSLSNEVKDVMRHLHKLWGFPIALETICENKVINTEHYPPIEKDQKEEPSS